MVVNGEEGEECVYQIRAKLYRLDHPDSVDKAKPSESAPGFSSHTFAWSTSSNPDAAEDARPAVTARVPEWVEVGTGPVRVLRPCSRASAPASVTEEQTMASNSELEGSLDRDEQLLQTETGLSNIVPVSGARVVMRRENQPGGQGEFASITSLVDYD